MTDHTEWRMLDVEMPDGQSWEWPGVADKLIAIKPGAADIVNAAADLAGAAKSILVPLNDDAYQVVLAAMLKLQEACRLRGSLGNEAVEAVTAAKVGILRMVAALRVADDEIEAASAAADQRFAEVYDPQHNDEAIDPQLEMLRKKFAELHDDRDGPVQDLEDFVTNAIRAAGRLYDSSRLDDPDTDTMVDEGDPNV
jgi:hypothetical protein